MSRLLICAALLGAALFGFIVRSVLQQVFERWWTSFEGDAAERGRVADYAERLLEQKAKSTLVSHSD